MARTIVIGHIGSSIMYYLPKINAVVKQYALDYFALRIRFEISKLVLEYHAHCCVHTRGNAPSKLHALHEEC
jgi:hypothetical protein